ncbi:unnamed protein product [Ilex paraguariensis]|uniref:Uncharacterized protein n=1 Tax=Ilex paraguariensis TaxID=185542 RepID=A0ABC8QLQ7_9AQUA
MIPNGHLESKVKAGEHLEKSHETIDLRTSQALADFNDISQQVGDPLQGSLSTTALVASLFRESVLKFGSSLKCQIHVPLFLVIALAVILLLMQISILVLLSRYQPVHVFPQADCISGTCSRVGGRGAETMAFMERQFNHLKDEMLIVERLLEKTQHNYALLKLQLEDLELLRKQQR